MTASTGNFIADLEDFDHRFFSISPREAKSMDPQQRLLLHCAHRALENAGYVPHSTPSFNPETFGCYIGAATNDYVQNLRDEIDVYYSTGSYFSFICPTETEILLRNAQGIFKWSNFACYATKWPLSRR